MKTKIIIGAFISLLYLSASVTAFADSGSDTQGKFGFFGDYPTITGKTVVSTKTLPDNSSIDYSDKYTLQELVVGEKYKAESSAIDKTTGEMTNFSGETTFVATNSSMSVNVPVRGKTHNMGGHTIVTFERLTDLGDAPARKGQVVLVNNDENDKDETLYVESKGGGALKTAVDTGGFNKTPLLIGGLAIAFSFLGGLSYMLWKRKGGR